MRWTVSRRIVGGYAVILLFLMVVAGMGAYTLSRIAGSFEVAIHSQEKGLAWIFARPRFRPLRPPVYVGSERISLVRMVN